MISVYRQIYTLAFTLIIFWVGIAIAAVVQVAINDPTTPFLGIFYTTINNWESVKQGDLNRLMLITAIGWAGLATMWVSSRLDFVDKDDDVFTGVVKKCVKLTVVVWALALLIAWVSAWVGEPPTDRRIGFSDFPMLLFFFLTRILGLVVIIPFVAAWLVFPVVCLGWVIGGVLSVARALTFLVTRHKLRGTYERGKRRATFNAKEVVANLGGKSTSQAQGRALLKDAASLLAETKATAARLNQELNGLSQKVQDDARRLEIEAELSKTLAEIEAAKIKIHRLKEKTEGEA